MNGRLPAVAALALVMLFLPTVTRAQVGDGQPLLVGSWVQTRAAIGAAPGNALYTFNSDGTMVLTNVNHPFRSPGHGAWTQTGDREFLTTFVALLFSEDGSFRGTVKLRQRIRFDDSPDIWSSEAFVENFDVEGNLTETNRTTGIGVRIQVEPWE